MHVHVYVYVYMCVKENWIRMSWRKWSQRKADKGREGNVSGGGISLEVVKMTSDDLLDVDAGGMVGKDKGNPIAVAGGKRRDQMQVKGQREGSRWRESAGTGRRGLCDGTGLLSKETGTEAQTAEEEFDIMSCPKFVRVGMQRNKAEAFAKYRIFSIGERKVQRDDEYLTDGGVGEGMESERRGGEEGSKGRFVNVLVDIINEASDEATLIYSAWNLYCPVRY
eukprot:g41619.t1